MKDLGYSIEWPSKYPLAIKRGVEYMKRIHFTWRAKKLQAPFSQEQIKMIRLKVSYSGTVKCPLCTDDQYTQV